MYTIYDLEISKEILSSLTFIAIESGITFNNKLQFNNIIYKLYNHLKDDFDFENGIKVNETLKSKINDFKNIYLELPDPNIEDGYKHLFTINSNDNAGTKFVDMEKIESTIGETYEFPYFFVPEGTGSNLYYRFSVFRSDGYERFVGSSTAIPTNTAYFKLTLEAQSSRYIAYIKFYNSEEELISTISYNGSSSYSPSDYPTFKINYLYHSNKIIECYNYLKNDFTIDENNLLNINIDNLNIDDVYYSSEIGFEKDNEEITINHLLNKRLNGEEFGFRYGTIQTHLNKICKFDGNVFKFLTITANEDETSYTGYVSTYPLYATNVNNELGLWFLSTYDKTPVKVFKSTNGSTWEEIKRNISSALPYDTDAIIVTSTALSYAGEDIVYSNYPVFYSLTGTNFEDEVSTIALENDNTFKLYRNSDEDFTLDRMPLGASFYFGKHKIEDSPRFPLIFRAMDYTNNINTAQNNDNWLPKDSVYCETPHLIDKLSFHNYKNNSSVNIMYENSHLPRWLNSDAPYGEWWEKINDDDSPSTPENMYNNNVSKGFEFGHRAGFLYHFDPKERALLQPFNGWDYYKGLKVLLLDKSETPDSFSKTYRPKIYKACGKSTIGILRPYFVKEMKYHRHADSAKMCSTQLNDFVCTKSDSFFWCRNKGTNNGQYSDLSSNGSPAYYGKAVRPVVCIDKDTKVIREPDEYGIFKLDLGIEETFDVSLEFEIERQIEVNETISYEVERQITISSKNSFEIKREIGISSFNEYPVERIIYKNSSTKYPLNRSLISSITLTYPTERLVNYFYTFKYPTALKIIRDTELKYPLQRDIIEEFSIEEKFEISRYVLVNIIERFNNLERNVLGIVNPQFTIRRFIQEEIESIAETVREVIKHQDFNFELERRIEKNINLDSPLRRKVVEDIERYFEISRDIFEAEVSSFEIQRTIRKDIENEYPTRRYVEKNIAVNYELLRFISEPYVSKFNLQRDILNNSLNKYPLQRKIKKEEIVSLTFNIIRDILNNTEFLGKVNRYVLENYSDDKETVREIIRDIEIINDNLKREVVVNMEENYPTKRFINSDTDKYVSKSNLILYTQLLKEEIAQYIDLRIAEEFEKRNL